MKNRLITKGLVFGIIMLFVGTSVVPANTNTNQRNVKDNNHTVKTAENKVYNIVGGVNITFNFPIRRSIQWVWWNATDRNFTYPIVNGTVDVNYTFVLQCYATGIFFMPRLTWLISTLYYPINISRGINQAWVIIFYKDVYPGKIRNIYVQCTHRMPTPLPDPNSDKTEMWAFNQLRIFAFPPTWGGPNNKIHFKFYDDRILPFWANFIS